MIHGDSLGTPGNADYVAGWLIERDAFGRYARGIASFRYRNGLVLTLDTLLDRTPRGRPIWHIQDVVDLPDATDSLGVATCQRKGQASDRTVFALLRWQPDTYVHTDLRGVWQVHPGTRRLAPLSPDSVECVNDY